VLKRAAEVVTFLVLCSGCVPDRPAANPALPTVVVRAGEREITAEVARTEDERRMGYMRREAPGETEGMLFVFRDEAIRAFWNHDVRFSVDIAFLDSEGRVVSVATMPPMDNRTVRSRSPARFALEMKAGAFDRYGIALGSLIKIPAEVTEKYND